MRILFYFMHSMDRFVRQTQASAKFQINHLNSGRHVCFLQLLKRKEGRKEGWQEGRREGMKEGRKEDERKNGRKKD
jgi:flagellar biosynthesis/type III secretory pathway protein FliH